MPGPYRIRVYGTPRKDIDPALLAQVVILLGRHLHQQRQQQHRKATDTGADVSSADHTQTCSSTSGDDRVADADDSGGVVS